MEKKMKRIPFDLERTKRITNRKEEGRIVMRSGSPVRVICFNRKSLDPNNDFTIVALSENWIGEEQIYQYMSTGKHCCDNEISDFDLFLEIPDDTPTCEFKPFDKILVRDTADDPWKPDFFSGFFPGENYPFHSIGGFAFEYCIPYNEQTAHLLWTSEDYKED